MVGDEIRTITITSTQIHVLRDVLATVSGVSLLYSMKGKIDHDTVKSKLRKCERDLTQALEQLDLLEDTL